MDIGIQCKEAERIFSACSNSRKDFPLGFSRNSTWVADLTRDKTFLVIVHSFELSMTSK